MFADILKAPAVQSLFRRVEHGGALSFAGVAGSAQPFFAALLQQTFPSRSIVVVAENLKTQESFQQDLETWAKLSGGKQALLFYPAWEMLPHEGKLPHSDVISERLQTLVALSQGSVAQAALSIVTSVTALLQKTYAPTDLKDRARSLKRGDSIAPLDLIEFLEEQGYEPEAQVSQKGEISLRGGILDIFPPTSPWPVRLEFFGDELESLRQFDPLTQISREEITEITLPPAGEVGILKRESEKPKPQGRGMATLLEHLPRETIFVLCDPESLAVQAENYAQQIPAGDAFYISWPDFLIELNRRGFSSVELVDDLIGGTVSQPPETGGSRWEESPSESRGVELEPTHVGCYESAGEGDFSPIAASLFSSLDAFRPLADRAPEPQIAEAQRREFFQQLHRWLRQNYAVHVFCNNDG